ncbi:MULTISPECIES: flavocytochrome c [unclassified Streptococcus]|uniref:flavocytochrome c n=1 Tax=unclassified Streptococcus TaxID=2608887 RepID=UPI001072D258|nr:MULTISPECIES: flavocytochrome c [unclassified Streptococcus]MBF0787525.1 flavocytochrome c [Streptococcus sp. 19428wC2_LYSM12]MCQ9211450.1 flavocytochrome c [Streptococcus sp. B01]MCQ9214765.1 flavocytochrome c [Streptococcus sp. O1]TFV05476.1 flavocytochrome c [Streptococcus sp. LYSM12]
MKKRVWLSALLSLLAVVFLIACGSKATNTAESSISASSSKEDAVSGASEKVYTDPAELKDSYDVVIIGSGGAGMAAGVSAHDAGASVAIFEKMGEVGGNTAKSSAGMNASQTKFQDKEGIKDSNDKFYEETLKGGGGTNNPELLRYLVDNSASAIDWLDGMGITLSNITTTGGMSEKRTHRPADGSAVGGYLVTGLYHNLVERKIPMFVNADVTNLEEKDGKISGIEVVIDGKTKKVAAKAVVIATGGFGADLDKVAQLNPKLKGYVTTNQPGSTGDGIALAEAKGAATVDMEQIQIHPTVEQEKSYLITEAIRGEGAILVNSKGERFFNELETRDKVSAAINSLEPNYAYVVFDSALKDRVKAIAQYEKKGLVKSGDTAADLAKAIDVPADALQTTLDTWNKAVADKNDSAFGRSSGMDHALDTAPYYAIKIAPGVHHTMGGLKINTNTEVLNKEGQVISGLYAAGEVTGGVHGNNRIGGNAVADIIVFGRQAGEQSAKFVKQ